MCRSLWSLKEDAESRGAALQVIVSHLNLTYLLRIKTQASARAVSALNL